MAAATRIHAALEHAVVVDGINLPVATSIGVAAYPEHGRDASTLLRCADVAMYAAKRAGVSTVAYTSTQDIYTPDRLQLIADLRRAIAAGALAMHYQPKVCLVTGEVVGLEALARWPHRERGFVPPDIFIPLAEQASLIGPLTRCVLELSLRQQHVWQQQGFDVPVAVNLSTANLHDPDLVDTILALLRHYDVPPHRLRLELTESAVMADAAHAITVLTRLTEQGIRVSVDDFGTGYSSLRYLKELPVDELKIDRSFVAQMVTVEADATIVASTIGLAHGLGLHVTAEGIENDKTWQHLARLGCDGGQGYYISRPLPASDLERWVRCREATITVPGITL